MHKQLQYDNKSFECGTQSNPLYRVANNTAGGTWMPLLVLLKDFTILADRPTKITIRTFNDSNNPKEEIEISDISDITSVADGVMIKFDHAKLIF
jgi:hypothetical protein